MEQEVKEWDTEAKTFLTTARKFKEEKTAKNQGDAD